MFKLGGYLKNYKIYIVLAPIFKLLETATDIVTPFLISKMIDVGISSGSSSYVLKVGGIVLVINVLGLFFAVFCQKFSSFVSEGTGKDIRREMFRHINTYSHAEFDRFTTMSLTNRCVHDVDQIQTAISATIRNIARAPFMLVGSLIMAILIDPQLSTIFVIVGPILFVVVFLIMKKTTPLYSQLKVNLDDVSNVTRENLSGVRVVRAFNKQKSELGRFKKENESFLQTELKVGLFGAILQPVLAIIVNFAIVGLIVFGGVRINVGGLTQGQVIAFINYFTQLANALITIARVFLIFTRTGASIKRIDDVFSVQNSVVEPSKPVFLTATTPAKIEFKDVCFSYLNTKNVVNNLSFKIMPGQTLGVIGGTGSGKTSVVNLIPRFYDTSSGEVLINDVNVKKYDIKSLREYVGYVPQKAVLFKGTIEDNLRWRKEDATEEEMIKALKIAQAFDFVKEKPNFLKEKVERGGTNFSGGQRQRLTIARALIGNPKILILDDSSSALDFATDAALRKSIYKNFKDTTTILVSQRTNTIKNCDKIIVLDNGFVVDVGTHDALLSRCGVYREIYESQNKEKGEKANG